MQIIIKGSHPQSHLIGAHTGFCPPHWVGTYMCNECHCVFEVDINDSPRVYQGNVAEDASCSCPECGNIVKLGSSYQLNTKLAKMFCKN